MAKIRKKHGQEAQKSKEKYRVTNWSSYNKSLINRGSLTLWINESVVDGWYYKGNRKPGGKVRYSDRCIESLLSLKALFGLGFRQTEGFASSLITLLGLNLEIPSYSQLCRRQAVLPVKLGATDRQKFSKLSGQEIHVVVDGTGLKVYGEGEWKVRQHGVAKRRTWRKLHLAIDERTGQVEAVELTGNEVDDAQMMQPLMAQIQGQVDVVSADGAYDKAKVYDVLIQRGIYPLIPPRKDAVYWTDEHGNKLDHPRNTNIAIIKFCNEKIWKKQMGYHRRSKAEVGMYRFKTIFGDRLANRKIEHQSTEARIKCACLNKLTSLGMPHSVKVA